MVLHISIKETVLFQKKEIKEILVWSFFSRCKSIYNSILLYITSYTDSSVRYSALNLSLFYSKKYKKRKEEKKKKIYIPLCSCHED